MPWADLFGPFGASQRKIRGALNCFGIATTQHDAPGGGNGDSGTVTVFVNDLAISRYGLTRVLGCSEI
jgi:hypothetical protein